MCAVRVVNYTQIRESVATRSLVKDAAYGIRVHIHTWVLAPPPALTIAVSRKLRIDCKDVSSTATGVYVLISYLRQRHMATQHQLQNVRYGEKDHVINNTKKKNWHIVWCSVYP